MSDNAARQEWMGLLARAPSDMLAELWSRLALQPEYSLLRAPEQGLVMTRGRTGAEGSPFNFGEIVITRCSVRLADGAIGHAYVAGRNKQKAEQAAVLDALLQEDRHNAEISNGVIEPLKEAEAARRQAARAKSAATKVDFFTMVRGED